MSENDEATNSPTTNSSEPSPSQTTLKPSPAPQTTLKPALVPQTTLKPAPVPQTALKPALVPQTTLKPAPVPQTTLKPAPSESEPNSVPSEPINSLSELPKDKPNIVVAVISDSDNDEVEIVEKKDKDKPAEGDQDKENCPICLGTFTNRSFLNQCFHAYCYYCILQWSEISQSCPLCKTDFSVIIHDVASIKEYKETVIQKNEPAMIPPDIRNNFRLTVRYRTTIHGSRDLHVIEDDQPSDQPPQLTRSNRHQRKRRRAIGPVSDEEIRIKEGRQRVYANNLYAKSPDGTEKLRIATPEFYSLYEGAKHRLFPWIKNELELLLYNNVEHVLFVLEIIWKLLDKELIKSTAFKDEVKGFLFDKTDHFCHELYMFAISPYDWKTYLKKVPYDEPTTGSRWDLSPVRYIGETRGDTEGDTISNTKWDENTPPRTKSETSSVEFIEEREMDVNITSNSSDSQSPRFKSHTTPDDPIIIDDDADCPETPKHNAAVRECPLTPVFIDLEDIPATPTPPASPVSTSNTPERLTSPEAGHPRASPIANMSSPCFPCSPIAHLTSPCSPIRHNSPNLARSPSPLKGKGKEKKKKARLESPVRRSPVRVLTDDSEPCSSRYLTS